MTPMAQGWLLRHALDARPIGIDELAGAVVLVFAPHPDDETLGCGGAIAAACRAGSRVVIAAVTDGRLSHPASARYPGDALAALRRRELDRAASLLTDGRGEVVWLGYSDQAAPAGDAALDEALARLASHVDLAAVTTIWASWAEDPHVDHVRTAALAQHLARALPQVTLWFYAVWGRFIEPAAPVSSARLRAFDTTAMRALKRRALAAHRSQMTGLIDDDPEGFVMTPEMQAHFIEAPELFIESARHG